MVDQAGGAIDYERGTIAVQSLTRSRGKLVASAPQSSNDEQKPCTVKPLPSSAFKVFNIAFAELTSNSGTLSALRSPSNASNCGVSGTEGECKWPTHPHDREGEWP